MSWQYDTDPHIHQEPPKPGGGWKEWLQVLIVMACLYGAGWLLFDLGETVQVTVETLGGIR